MASNDHPCLSTLYSLYSSVYFYILQAIDELLKYKANPSLLLTHGNGNALCVASHTAYEHRRSPDGRIDLVR